MRLGVVAAMAAVMATASIDADAGGGGRHHHYRHHRTHVGVFIGAPLLLSPFWAHTHYAPPVVVRERVIVREPLVFYDEYGRPVPAQSPQQQSAAVTPTWFFCPDSQSYYPYVQTCASQWQRVAPTPPGQ